MAISNAGCKIETPALLSKQRKQQKPRNFVRFLCAKYGQFGVTHKIRGSPGGACTVRGAKENIEVWSHVPPPISARWLQRKSLSAYRRCLGRDKRRMQRHRPEHMTKDIDSRGFFSYAATRRKKVDNVNPSQNYLVRADRGCGTERSKASPHIHGYHLPLLVHTCCAPIISYCSGQPRSKHTCMKILFRRCQRIP